LSLGVQDQACGIGLGIAADNQNSLPHLGQCRQGVLGGSGLADTALTVKRDLPQFHVSPLFLVPFRFDDGIDFSVGLTKAISMPFEQCQQAVRYQRNRRIHWIVGLVSKATSGGSSVGNKTTRHTKQPRN
jgi:hypothetical protein